MTPEEIREKLIELLHEDQPLKDFEALIERAIESDREACAAIADSYADIYHNTARHIAAAIRARGKAR